MRPNSQQMARKRPLRKRHLGKTHLRYVKTLQKAEAASQKLSDLCSDLDCPEDMVHHWVEDVRQWAKAAFSSGLLQRTRCISGERNLHERITASVSLNRTSPGSIAPPLSAPGIPVQCEALRTQYMTPATALGASLCQQLLTVHTPLLIGQYKLTVFYTLE
ncbi:unnamed protein product [Gadus morhua 'NCC']